LNKKGLDMACIFKTKDSKEVVLYFMYFILAEDGYIIDESMRESEFDSFNIDKLMLFKNDDSLDEFIYRIKDRIENYEEEFKEFYLYEALLDGEEITYIDGIKVLYSFLLDLRDESDRDEKLKEIVENTKSLKFIANSSKC
jgi:hypothetical protein